MKERIINDYRPYLSKLSELSYDKEHAVSLIADEASNHRMYNFDGISENFFKKVRGEKNKSCDGYFEKNPQETYLVEFKNQEEGSVDKKWLKNKIYDSVSTLVMNENVSREDVAGRTTVIIVYNDGRKQEKTNSDYTTSQAFNAFSKKMAALAGRQGILDCLDKKFDLERYKGVLFKEVYTVDKKDFEQYFMDIIFK